MNPPLNQEIEMVVVRGTILLAVFWVIYFLFGSHPRARVMLCRGVSVMLLLLPFVGFIPVPTVTTVSSLTVMTQPLEMTVMEAPRVSKNSKTVAPVVFTPASPVIKEEAPLQVKSWTVADLLLVVWMTGTGVLLVRWFIAMILSRRLARTAQPAPDWVTVAESAFSAHLGLGRPTRIEVVDEACSPLLIGPAPLILLPRHLLTPNSEDDALSALAHELAHVKGKDWFWSQWLHVVLAFLWPLPLIWFLRRAHDSACELICDHEAAVLRGGHETYAESLARQSLFVLGRVRLATLPMVRRSGIRRRIDSLLSGVRLPGLTRRMVMAMSLSILVACGLLAGIHLAKAQDKAAPVALTPAENDAWLRHNYSAADIQKIISQLYGHFQAISAVSYTGTEVTQLDDYFDNEQQVMKTNFVSSGDRYLIRLGNEYLTSQGQPISDPAPKQAPTSESMAFNGQIFQDLGGRSPNSLWIQKGPPFYPAPPALTSLGGRDYFTMPFDFVSKSVTEDPYHPVMLIPELFKHPEYWVLKMRRFQNGTLLGKRGLIMDIQGKQWQWGSGDSTTSVLLDPARNYYPVAWQFPVGPAGRARLISYVITEFGTVEGGGQSLPYPKTATLTETEGDKVIISRTITVTQASINDIALDDPRFTLDPTKADSVHKMDDPQPPYDYKALKARQDALIAQQNAQMAGLHLPDDKTTAIVTEGVMGDIPPLPNLIVQAVNLCPAASIVLSWHGDGRYIPDSKGDGSPVGITPPNAENPWINWRTLPPGQGQESYINAPTKAPIGYANDIYQGIYWSIGHGFNTVIVLNSFESGDRPSATQAVIAAMRAAKLRLIIVTPQNKPYKGLADYAQESGGTTLVSGAR